MKFENAFRQIVARVRVTNVARKTRARWNAKFYSPDRKLSKIFGYRVDGDVARVIPSEASQVVLVLDALAAGMSPSRIKAELLDPRNFRNRSGRRWTVREISLFPRYLYSGLIQTPLGFRRSKVYPALVKASVIKSALRTLKTTSEAVELAIFLLQEGAMMQGLGE